MTQGFYEQLGVTPDADAETLRQAYHRQVARVTKRRRELAAQGGDTQPLDLTRAKLDEAWSVLSVPARRQRYDAMLQFLDEGTEPESADALWEAVGGRLVPPSVAAAAGLLSKATGLALPNLADELPEPEPAGFPEAATTPTLAPTPTLAEPTALGDATQPTAVPSPSIAATEPGGPSAPVVNLTDVTRDLGGPRALKVVDQKAAPVLVLPQDAPRQKTLTPDQIGQLTDAHGYSGGLLRAVREAKGITLQEVADSTRISVRYLQAIEADAHDRLPSAPFVKGYVREVARLLKLDDEAVVAGYMRRMQA